MSGNHWEEETTGSISKRNVPRLPTTGLRPRNSVTIKKPKTFQGLAVERVASKKRERQRGGEAERGRKKRVKEPLCRRQKRGSKLITGTTMRIILMRTCRLHKRLKDGGEERRCVTLRNCGVSRTCTGRTSHAGPDLTG